MRLSILGRIHPLSACETMNPQAGVRARRFHGKEPRGIPIIRAGLRNKRIDLQFISGRKQHSEGESYESFTRRRRDVCVRYACVCS
jgi:hypothetical protein